MLLARFYSVETLCDTFAFDVLAESRKVCEGCVQGPGMGKGGMERRWG